MSFKTWCEQYYPVEAITLHNSTDLDAISHSLRKWQGLQPEALAAHRVHLVDGGDYQPYKVQDIADPTPANTLVINGQSCALCVQHDTYCESCPFYLVFGSECDQPIKSPDDGIDGNPWSEWNNSIAGGPNSSLMIKALTALEQEYSKREGVATDDVI